MSTTTTQQTPNQPSKGSGLKVVLIIMGFMMIVTMGAAAYFGLGYLKQHGFLTQANDACKEVAQLDTAFGGLMDSQAPARDEVLKQSSEAASKIGELKTQLSAASAPADMRAVQASLCQALGQHQKLYETISSQAGGTVNIDEVKQALDSASALYLLVDQVKLPLVKTLPALTGDRLGLGLGNLQNAAVVAQQPEPPKQDQIPPPPPPAVEPTTQKPAPPPAAAPAPPAEKPKPVVAQAKPAPPVPAVVKPKPAPKPQVAVRKPVARKPKKAKQIRTATFRCPYRGCNAWFVKASLLQKHKKYCIYRPGGPGARSRRH